MSGVRGLGFRVQGSRPFGIEEFGGFRATSSYNHSYTVGLAELRP